MVEAAGYVPVALTADDYIELLPARWHAVNAYGIKVNRRTYDSDKLNPFRQQHSGVKEHKNLWEIHHDPYDVSRIWVRDHWNGGWDHRVLDPAAPGRRPVRRTGLGPCPEQAARRHRARTR